MYDCGFETVSTEMDGNVKVARFVLEKIQILGHWHWYKITAGVGCTEINL